MRRYLQLSFHSQPSAVLAVALAPRRSELQDEDDVAKNHDELEAIRGEAAAQRRVLTIVA